MAEIVIPVKGMKCAGCSKRIEDALRSMPGVAMVNADHKGARVVISLDTTKTTVDQVRQRIMETGYKPE